MTDVMPSSLVKTPFTHRNVRFRNGLAEVPVYCMNCSKLGLWVREDTLHIPGSDFIGYLCVPCAEKYGAIFGTMAVPDEVFAEKFIEVQHEHYHRILTPQEVARELGDINSPLSRLKREREQLTKTIK